MFLCTDIYYNFFLLLFWYTLIVLNEENHVTISYSNRNSSENIINIDMKLKNINLIDNIYQYCQSRYNLNQY
jgi:hypothetical protein